jgi:hypothetical protein
LRSILRGVTPEPNEAADGMPMLRVGATGYPAASEGAEYVVLAKAYVPATPNPVLIGAGQTARTNLAAARFLASQHRKLLKSYGVKGEFCLALKIVDPLAFGPDFVGSSPTLRPRPSGLPCPPRAMADPMRVAPAACSAQQNSDWRVCRFEMSVRPPRVAIGLNADLRST